jgi:hypothetical protein
MNIEEVRKKRFEFLHVVYEKAGGDRFRYVRMWDVGVQLGLTHEETERIAQYLVDEHLLAHAALGGLMAITHYGIQEVENALSHPDQATQHFPPVNIISIHHMENSQIQQGVIQSNQVVSFQLDKKEEIDKFVQLLKTKLSQLHLSSEDGSELKSDIATLEVQITSSRPKPGVLRECLMSIQRILESAAGEILAQELLRYLPPLLAAFK